MRLLREALDGSRASQPSVLTVAALGASRVPGRRQPDAFAYFAAERLRRARRSVCSQVAVKPQADPSSIRNSARLAWYLAAALLVSDPCMSGRPSDVERYHLNVRRRCLRWISKSGR
ncbi:hypothetical protein SAMN05216338_106913 [Bradyrhizobium sp. Rc2d]|nr:hypothetical protein SAMN05216338_106913 [Bradyrhizobium sp. Rc2d]